MPVIKSAKKALRQTQKRTKNNLRKKQALKTARKAVLASLQNPEHAKENLRKFYKAVDKAAKTKYLKKNKANRLKSRLAKKLKAVK